MNKAQCFFLFALRPLAYLKVARLYRTKRPLLGLSLIARTRLIAALAFGGSLLLLTLSPLSAQTAAELETVLKTPAVSCAQAAWFVLSAGSDSTLAPATAAAAFEQAVARGWLKNVQPNNPITLGRLSFLVMRAFGMKGGMMYTLLPGPRYAFRSMVNRSYIQGTTDPGMIVSGERFLAILGKVLSGEGDGI